MNRIADLFYNAVSIRPEKTAIFCDGVEVSYRRLSGQVSRYSNFMTENGIRYGDRIGIPMINSVQSVALMLAAANIGSALVPISPSLPVDAVKKAFKASGVKHIMAKSIFFEEAETSDETFFDEFKGNFICLDETRKNTISLETSEKYSDLRPVSDEVCGDETFIITMTSGSTGSPKPIVLTQKNKLERSKLHIRLYNITAKDKILAATPLYHSLAERLVLMPLLIGASSVLLSGFTPNLWLKCVREQGVTFSIAVSAQLAQIREKLGDAGESYIESLRCIVSSSSLLDEDTKDDLIKKLRCEFHEMYGTSETSTVTDICFDKEKERKKSVGRAVRGAGIKIIREDASLAAPHEIGEIACRTCLMCNGYYGLDDAFKESFDEGYFKTGDLGYLDDEGFLYFSGRKKEIIITGGINVYPADIEECVYGLGEVEECAAFAYPDDKLGEAVGLAVVVKKGGRVTKRALQVRCATGLADFQQPRKIFFVTELPKNGMGKIQRLKLIESIKSSGECE